MFLKTLSPSKATIIVMLPGFVLLAVAVAVINVLRDHLAWALLGAGTVSGLAFWGLFSQAQRAYAIKFNHELLVLESKRERRELAFSNVRALKLLPSDNSRTRVLGMQLKRYKLIFINEQNVRETVEFQVAEGNERITEFQQQIRQQQV